MTKGEIIRKYTNKDPDRLTDEEIEIIINEIYSEEEQDENGYIHA